MLCNPRSVVALSFAFTLLLGTFALPLAADETPKAEPAREPEVAQIWYGVLQTPGREFRFVVTATEKDGKASAKLLSLDEGAQSFQLDAFDLTADKLSFELKQTRAAFEGERSKSGDLVTGSWKQSGQEFDLDFRQVKEAPRDKPAEVWTGELATPLQKLKVRLRVYAMEDKSEKVLFDSVTQKAGGFVAERKIDGKDWTVEVPVLSGKFVGKSNDEASEIAGKWSQGGLELDLTWKRDDSAADLSAAPPNRPQTPKEPFPYEIETVTFENKADGVKLAGTLTLPKSNKPAPAVVMISGSGPQDRDETLLDHKPFWIIADYLSRNGIAVLRYDDRGVGGSTGDFEKATSEDFSRDAEAAFDFLRKHAKIDSGKIGLAGHSEGGLVAPMVAARREEVAFLVLLAGTGVNGRQILMTQVADILRSEGKVDEAELAARQKVQAIVQDAVALAAADASEDKLVADVLEQVNKLPPEVLKAAGEEDEVTPEKLEQVIREGVKQLNSPWMRFFLAHEPGPVLARVKCPVLALNGEKDVQVAADKNLAAIQTALEESGNRRGEFIKLAGLNHLFQTCKSGAVSEYATIEETIAPAALETIGAWVLGRLDER